MDSCCLHEGHREALIRRAIKLFKCDTARITSPCGRHFLILGWNKNTKTERGQWYRNGEPMDFDYVHEEVVANGYTFKELWKNTQHYKRLLANRP